MPPLPSREVETEEYRKMADVEDAMWYYRGLHARIERELENEGTKAEGGRRTEAAPAAEGWRVLDAGCGTGGLIRRLSARHPGWRWTGVDVSPLACALARERTAVEIVEASVTALPFASGTFDAVVSADVLYHIDDDGAALREFARVLRPGGKAIINVPAHRWLWSYHDVVTHARRRYESRDLRARMKAAGFREVAATHWNTLLLPLLVVRRKLLPEPSGGSDVHVYPAPVERIFDVAMALERGWTACGATLPVGSSVLAVGAK